MKNEILKLISELEARRKSHSDKAISARLADVEYIEYEHIGRERECDFLIAKLWLLLKDESKQPQPPDFANTMLGEVPHEVSAEHQESTQVAVRVIKKKTSNMNKIITNSKYFLKQLTIIKNGCSDESIEMVADKSKTLISFGYLVNSSIECQNDFIIPLYRKPMLRLIKHLELIDEQPITLQFEDSELFNIKICEMVV